MSKLTVLLNVTADGFVSDPTGGLEWHLPFWDDELCHCLIGAIGQADTILLGRNTYEALKAHCTNTLNNLYASRTDQLLAETLHQHHKLAVTSQRLHTPWYNTDYRMLNDLLYMPQMQADSGGEVVVIGSVQLVQWLVCKGLISGYTVWHHPLRIGSGIRISESGNYLKEFAIMQEQKLSSGVTQIKYSIK